MRAKSTRGIRGSTIALRKKFERVRNALGVGLFAHIAGDEVVAAQHFGEFVLADDGFGFLHASTVAAKAVAGRREKPVPPLARELHPFGLAYAIVARAPAALTATLSDAMS